MNRTVSTSGWMLYPQSDGSQAPQPQQQAPSGGNAFARQGMLQEYGGLAKNALAPTSTSIAEGYNKVYDFATGFKGAPGTNLTTGTTSSGTFGGSNLTNAAYGYAGGKLANELFDNKGYSDLGGTLGASLGASAAVGGSTLGASMASLGSFASPVGAVAGAVLGAAVGSLFGSKGISDSSFRTYSGELGSEASDFNKEIAQRDGIAQRGGYVQREAGGKYQDLTTFAYAQDLSSGVMSGSIASTDTPFGKYTVALVDDMKNEDELSFSNAWVDRVGQIDTAFSKLLTPDEIALAKKGMTGTAQASLEWEKKSQANVATADMLIDRYARIAQLAGRDDIYQDIVKSASAPGVRANGGVEMIGEIIQKYEPRPSVVRSSTASGAAPERAARRQVLLSKPTSTINKAKELSYV